MLKVQLHGGPLDGELVNLPSFTPAVCFPIKTKDLSIRSRPKPGTDKPSFRAVYYELSKKDCPLGYTIIGKYRG